MSHTTHCPACGHLADRRPEVERLEPIEVERNSDHHKALKALRKKPLLAEQVAKKIHRSPNEAAARLLELRRGGQVEYVVDADTGRIITRRTSRGAEARLQRITARGRVTLGEL
jgi:hypothetical protein